MEGDLHSNLTGIAAVALAAVTCGILMERLRQPALVGYILAGVLLGPSGFAMVEDRHQIDVLAELGVLMLLFLVGMELSLRSFRRLWKLAFMMTGFQIVASVGVMLLLSLGFGWSTGLSVLLGFVIAVSSTAVAIKMLEDLGELRTRAGRIAVGVLIAQDLAVVPMMLGVSAMGGEGFDWMAVPKIAFSIAFLVGLILFLSSGRKVRLPLLTLAAGHTDLKPLAALAMCFCLSALSGVLGLSAAYGAFIAGLVIGNSTERKSMLEAAQPIQSVLLMVFFLSIGLLIDLTYMWQNLAVVMTLFFLAAIFKTALNVVLLGFMGQPWRYAFLGGIMISQIGEFSFLLSVVGVEAGVISRDESRIVVAVTVMSLALSPIWIFTARRLQLLAQYGITEYDEFLRLVYGPEAELVAGTFDGAMTESQRTVRRFGLWLRRRRLRRRRKRQAKKDAPKLPAPTESTTGSPDTQPPPAATQVANAEETTVETVAKLGTETVPESVKEKTAATEVAPEEEASGGSKAAPSETEPTPKDATERKPKDATERKKKADGKTAPKPAAAKKRPAGKSAKKEPAEKAPDKPAAKPKKRSTRNAPTKAPIAKSRRSGQRRKRDA